MLLDRLSVELRNRLRGVREQPLDQPPIPQRRPLRPSPHTHQKRGPPVEYVQIPWTWNHHSSCSDLLLFHAFTLSFRGASTWGLALMASTCSRTTSAVK